MIELLAPVGSRDALTAAVESGADAVYLAGKMFGARASAPNFTDEELAEAVNFAHLRGVAVYVTVNTLIDNNEIALLSTYLQYLYQIGVDAIIIQDTGVLAIARQVVPQLPIHASTQMTVHNLAGVQLLAEQGLSRVVVSRELSLEDLHNICKNTQVEIEAFVHGALCISYSGQCLMSSMIGGRSGNRGRCAQPCRLPYTLVGADGSAVLPPGEAGEYLLSPRDLNTLELIPDLIAAGVHSFKIEGRMKRPEYVAVVVDTYRRAIDACLAQRGEYSVAPQEQKDLAQIFNRDFTTAFLEKNQGRHMMSDRRPNNRGVRIGRVCTYDYQKRQATIKLDEPLYVDDIVEFWVKVGGRVSATINEMLVKGKPVQMAPAGAEVTISAPPVKVNDRVFKVFDAGLMERARGFFSQAEAVRRIAVEAVVKVKVGEPLTISLRDADGFTARASTEFIAEPALKRPLTEDSVRKQLDRLGTTVFSLQSLVCQIEGDVMVPLSEINEARRQATQILAGARLAVYKRPPLAVREYSAAQLLGLDRLPEIAAGNRKRVPQLVVSTDTLAKVEAALQQGADLILFGGETFHHRPVSAADYRQAVEMVRSQGAGIVLATPRIVKEWQMKAVEQEFALFAELAPDAVSIANLGVLKLARQQLTLPLYADYPLNIYNDAALQFMAGQGFSGATLSPELNFAQLGELHRPQEMSLECLVHGHLTMMVSEYCMLGSFLGNVHNGPCRQPCLSGAYRLSDRKQETFPVVTDQFCRMHILNGKELSLLPFLGRFAALGIDRLRIEGKTGTAAELAKITRQYKDMLQSPVLRSGGTDKADVPEGDNITRGHYFRGVL